MCGRFVSATSPDDVADYFGAVPPPQEQVVSVSANYNVAPTTEVLVVRARDGHRQLNTLRWGLVPFWAKDLKVGARMINARSETVADKPAFRRAYAKRRCLIPADGFYEWAKIEGGGSKQPYFIHREDGEPIVFAGLWERWSPKSDTEEQNEVDGEPEVVETCTILTCVPNRTMEAIHDRMPVLVPNRYWDDWLDPSGKPDRLSALLQPAPDDLLVLRPVSTAVNNVRNNGPELLEPAVIEPGVIEPAVIEPGASSAEAEQ